MFLVVFLFVCFLCIVVIVGQVPARKNLSSVWEICERLTLQLQAVIDCFQVQLQNFASKLPTKDMGRVSQPHIHDVSTYQALIIVLQLKDIENESYVALTHILCIALMTAINMLRDDKACLYLQQERRNIISILFIETILSISIDIMHILIACQYPIINLSPLLNVTSVTPYRPLTDHSPTPYPPLTHPSTREQL